jgi:hypothetical protein
MEFTACTVAVCPVRKEPAHEAEMVNQLLFGDVAEVLEKGKGNWSYVRGLADGYEGWVNKQQLESLPEAEARQENYSLIWNNHLFHPIETSFGAMLIPCASSLRNFSKGIGRMGNFEFRYTGEDLKSKGELSASTEKVACLLKMWLNVPYLWGGRQAMGIDCSGLTQVIYKMMGIDLPRDAWQQALKGTNVDFIQQSQPGDLAFFDDEHGKIYHVGILLSNGSIVHASGKVREDRLDASGIVHTQTGARTHSLRIIKRYF